MKKFKRVLGLLLCGLLCLNGCADGGSKERPSVWLIAKSTQTEFWKASFAGANAAKAEYNLDLTIRGPETEEDFMAQNHYIEEAVQQGADAIVFSAISYAGNAKAVDYAASKGVKVVVIDSDVDAQAVSVRVGTDNIEAGRMAAQAVLDLEAPKLRIGIINYSVVSRNGEERETGLREVLEKDPRVEQIVTVNVLTSPEAARAQTEILLQKHPDLNVLLALNEPLAVGAAQAVDARNLENQVHLIGFDAHVQCVDYLQTGEVSALVVQNPYAMGYLGVEAAYKVLQGKTYSPDALINTSTTIVTKNNMFTTESQKVLFSFG